MLPASLKTENGLWQVCAITLLLKCMFLWIIHGAAPGIPHRGQNVLAIADTGAQTM